MWSPSALWYLVVCVGDCGYAATGCRGSMVASSLALRRISQQQTGLIAGSLFVDPLSIFQNFVDPCNYRQRSLCAGARSLAPIALSFYVQGTRTWLHTCLYMLAKVDMFCLPFPHVVFVLFPSLLSLSSHFLFICNSIILLMCKLPLDFRCLIQILHSWHQACSLIYLSNEVLILFCMENFLSSCSQLCRLQIRKFANMQFLFLTKFVTIVNFVCVQVPFRL